MSADEKIKILIVDDHAVVREGLRTLIEAKPDMEVVGEAADGQEAIAWAQALQPDVVLLDMVMPRKSGLEAIAEIKQISPQTRILVLTSFDNEEKVFAALKAGALGYLLKDTLPQQLIQAIRDVYIGQAALHPTIALKMIQEFNQPSDQPSMSELLTEREVETLKLVAQGLTNQEISERLTISERTVGKYVSQILEKLHVANRTQAALYALRKGLVDLDSE